MRCDPLCFASQSAPHHVMDISCVATIKRMKTGKHFAVLGSTAVAFFVAISTLGGAHKMRQNHLLEVDFIVNSMVLLRFVTCVNEACACWVAGAILSVSRLACRFFGRGAAVCAAGWSIFMVEKMFFVESQWQGCANMAQCQKVGAGTAFCESIEKWQKLRGTAGSLTRTAVLGASNSQPGESLLRFAGRGNTLEACE